MQAPTTYISLHTSTGLIPKTLQAARVGLANTLVAVQIAHFWSTTIIGMGRILGDSGWVFHESTLPFFQRIRIKALGKE